MENKGYDPSAEDTKVKEKHGIDEANLKKVESMETVPQFKMTKFQIIKNLVVVSFGFLFLFTSFQSLSNLQSSLNSSEGLGTAGLSVIYGALVLSCMFLPPFVIDVLGCKWSVALSMLTYILYMVANFYARWGTIIPAAIILGIGAAPLWSAKCTYLTETGSWYAKMTGATDDDVINRFFGVFFMIFQTSQIWGNLISSLVFNSGITNRTEVPPEALALCGANNCPHHKFANNSNLEPPAMEQVYMLCGIYVGFAVIGFLICAVLLDRLVLTKDENREPGRRKLSFSLILDTFRHMGTSRYQQLLIPLTFYSGIEQAFIASDFTASYIRCSLGIWHIGYVMICYGVVDAACSFLFGRLVQYVGHIPFFILAFLVHLGCQIAFLLWMPVPGQIAVFYILAALWGMGDAVIQTQINALYGYLFTDKPEAAFANYRLWESLGFIAAFGYSSHICTDRKLYICIGTLTLGMVGYGAVEILHRRGKRGSMEVTKS